MTDYELPEWKLVCLLLPCSYCGARPGQWCRAAKTWQGVRRTKPWAERPLSVYLHGPRYDLRNILLESVRTGKDFDNGV